jgi:hypothetical protein
MPFRIRPAPPGWDTVRPDEVDDLFTRFLDEQLGHRTTAFHAYQQCIRESRQVK